MLRLHRRTSFRCEFTTTGLLWVATAAACVGFAASEEASAHGRLLPAVPWQPGPRRYSVALPGGPQPTVSLYPPDGVVNVATGNTLRTSLSDPKDGGANWYFVELYEHMCPHCWYAVPIVTDVAHAFKGNPIWRTAAVNCHMKTNREVCLFLEMISGAAAYPTFLLCPPKGQGGAMWGANKLVRTLPEAAQSLFSHLAGEARATFVDLLHCRTRFKPQRDSQPGGEFLSAAEIADWVVQHTGLSCANPGRLTQGADFVDKMIQNPFSPPGPPGWLRDDKEGEPGVLAFSPEHRWWDALLGFVSALNIRYRPHKHNLIVSCVQFLARTFPVKGRALLDLVKRLLAKGPMHNSRDVTKTLRDWSKHHELTGWEDEGNIQTCSGSSSVSNCAMWALLHVTLTAVATRGITGRDLNNDQAMAQQPGGDDMKLSIISAVDFVRTYITVFQTCHHCTVQFNAEFTECAYGRCKIMDYRSLPLWLWRAHNAISLRASMRFNLTVDRRWPMYEDCPRCWQQHIVMGMESDREKRAIHRWKWRQRLSSSELDAVFNLDHVFWHMVRWYIGLERVPPLEAAKLTKKEMTEMSATTQQERYEEERKEWRKDQHNEAGRKEYPEAAKVTGSMGLTPSNSEAMENGEGNHMQVLAASAGVFAVGAAAALLLCNYQQLLGGPERASRAPLIRAPQEEMEAYDDIPSQLPEGELVPGDISGAHHDVDADEATE